MGSNRRSEPDVLNECDAAKLHEVIWEMSRKINALERDKQILEDNRTTWMYRAEAAEARVAELLTELGEACDLRDTAVKNWRDTEGLLRSADAALEAVGGRVERLSEALAQASWACARPPGACFPVAALTEEQA